MDATSLLLVRGIIAIIAGMFAIVWPGLTISFLVLLFGAYAFFDGIMNLVMGFRHAAGRERSWPAIVQGLVGIAAGVLAFAWPNVTALALLFFIASWAIVTGAFEIVAAVRLRREIRGEWLLALSGILSIGLGVVLFAFPAFGLVGLAWALGAYAAASGVVLVALAIRLRTLKPVLA